MQSDNRLVELILHELRNVIIGLKIFYFAKICGLALLHHLLQQTNLLALRGICIIRLYVS